jgi:copper chaperone CopZ
MLIEMEVGGLEGVTGVTVDHRTGVAQVSHDTDRIRPEDIVAVITKLGYGAEVDSA